MFQSDHDGLRSLPEELNRILVNNKGENIRFGLADLSRNCLDRFHAAASANRLTTRLHLDPEGIAQTFFTDPSGKVRATCAGYAGFAQAIVG